MTTSILVTGGAGYVGSHACKALRRRGYVPVVLDNLARGHREAVRWGPLVEGDLGDGELVRRTVEEHGVEAVLHFGAFAYVGESMQEPGLYFRNNVAGTLNLLDALVACGVRRIVFSSTCATYGLPHSTPIREEQSQRPVNPYGESKLFVERALHWYEQAHGLRWMALRYFNAAGADPEAETGEDHHPETHLVPLVLAAASGDRPHVEVYGTDYPTPDGTAIRDYVHVDDLADAHLAALAWLETGGECQSLNLGTGRGHSVREVIASVEQLVGRPLPVVDRPRRPGDPPELVADASRAQDVLGWIPRRSDLHTIVETAWRWHRKQAASRTLASVAGRLEPEGGAGHGGTGNGAGNGAGNGSGKSEGSRVGHPSPARGDAE